jgi:RND family efflux transporter MFP subunit
VKVLVLLGTAGLSVDLLAQESILCVRESAERRVAAARSDAVPVYVVTRDKLRVTVVERGVVEAPPAADAYCLIETGAVIRSILPEGTIVPAGEPVCELDSSDLQDQFVNQLNAEYQADAALRDAKVAREFAETAFADFTATNLAREPIKSNALRADIENARSNERAIRRAWQFQHNHSNKLRAQIQRCTFFAPVTGRLVYGNKPSRQGQAVIEVGATVHHGQRIFSIDDLGGRMQVNIKVRESAIDSVKVGLKAQIRVDAVPAELLGGAVSEVAPLPDPIAFFVGWIKTYTTRVRLDEGLTALRPGMTANVEILVAELDKVLTVPVQSVIRRGEQDQLAIRMPAGDFKWRRLNLGLRNDDFIEVKQGIQVGEVVALDPRFLLSEQEKHALDGAANEPSNKSREAD